MQEIFDQLLNRFDVFSFIVGIILTIVAAFLIEAWSVRKNREHSEELSRQTGAFKKPSPIIQAFFLAENHEYDSKREEWYFVFPGKTQDIVVYELTIYIGNLGEVKIEKPILTILAPSDLLPEDALKNHANLAIDVQLPSRRAKIEHSISTVNNTTVCTFAFPDLPPKGVSGVNIPIAMRSSKYRLSDSKSPAAENLRQALPFGFDVSFSLARLIDVTLSGNNITPVQKQLSVSAIPARDLIEAVTIFQTEANKNIVGKKLLASLKDYFNYTSSVRDHYFLEQQIVEKYPMPRPESPALIQMKCPQFSQIIAGFLIAFNAKKRLSKDGEDSRYSIVLLREIIKVPRQPFLQRYPRLYKFLLRS